MFSFVMPVGPPFMSNMHIYVHIGNKHQHSQYINKWLAFLSLQFCIYLSLFCCALFFNNIVCPFCTDIGINREHKGV